MLGSRQHYSRSRNNSNFGNFFMLLAFRICSGLIMYIPLPFDNTLLLCMSYFKTWWSDNTQLMMGISDHLVNLVAHYETFSFH